jgi:hypothetical protein
MPTQQSPSWPETPPSTTSSSLAKSPSSTVPSLSAADEEILKRGSDVVRLQEQKAAAEAAAREEEEFPPPPAGAPSESAQPAVANTEELKDLTKKLFSKARHNKLKEMEEMFDAPGGFPLSINVRDTFGNSLLSIAAQNGHKQMMKMLLKRHCDINAQNHKGQTALHFCFAYGYTDLAEWLISKGANDQLRNVFGLTCYEGLGPR